MNNLTQQTKKILKVLKDKRLIIGSSVLLVALVVSFVFSPYFADQIKAASYTTTWSTQGDFQNNTITGQGATTITNTDTTTTSGSAIISLQNPSNASETFTATTNIDTANSTATISGGALVRNTTGSSTDLFSSAGFSTNFTVVTNKHLWLITEDPTSGTLFVSNEGVLNSSARIGKYDPATDTLTADVLYNIGATNRTIRSIAYSTSTSLVYFGGGAGSGSTAAVIFGSYNPSTGAISNLTSNITSAFGSGNGSSNNENGIWKIITAPGGGTLYLFGWDTSGNSVLASYNTSSNTVTNLTSSSGLSGFVSTKKLRYATFDSTNNIYYGGGTAGLFFKYSPSSGTATDLSSVIGSSDTLRVTADNSGTAIYVTDTTISGGCTDLIKYIIASNSITTYSTGSSICANNGSFFHSGNGYLYLFGENASSVSTLGYFNPSDASFTTLFSAAGGQLLSVSDTSAVVFAIENYGDRLYIQTDKNDFIRYDAPPATQSAQSVALDSLSTNIPYATLTKNDAVGTGAITYYLSNDGGSNWQTATSGSQVNFSTNGSSLKWKVSLTENATVYDLTISYNSYYATSTIANLKQDAVGDAQWISISWNGSTPSGSVIKFRSRGATSAQGAGALTSASWSPYYTTSGASITNESSVTLPTYRYFEIELTLESGSSGMNTPTLTDFTVTYAINAPPAFDTSYPSASGSGVFAEHVATSTDSEWGNTIFSYRIKDEDTNSGTYTPGYVTPTFEYRLTSNGSWTSIGSAYLTSGATSNKAVSQASYTTYTAYWDAESQIGETYSAAAQIKVSLNDNEVIYNTASASTTAFILDTRKPTTTLTIDGSVNTVTLVASDNSLIKDYQLSNNSNYSADGSNAISGSWQTATSTSFSLTTSWVLTGTSSQTVYYQMRDIYGNNKTGSAVAPIAPASAEIQDISTPSSSLYREFIAWTPYTSATGATFSKYEVYRSTNGSSYSLLANVTDSATNYYLDTSVASTTTYYYKVRSVDSDGDVSGYSSVVSDQPDGQGGTDTVAPNVTSVSISDIKNTSAKVTFTTDELSTGRADYGLTNSFGSTASSTSYVTSHSVYITGLTPSTTYYVRARATDVAGNVGTNDNSGAGYSFTTAGGTVISNVTISNLTDNSAEIFWNTSTDSSSYVDYSTDSTLATYSTVGSASLVGGSNPFQHRVTISSLSSATRYYFRVRSIDGSSNTTTDDNTGSFYNFLTTLDQTAPVISNISTPVLSPNAVVVVWQTDEDATSAVMFGTTASTSVGSYASTTPTDTTKSIYHVVTITPLTAETTYYYRVQSKDAANNTTTSSENSFTTTEEGEITVITVGGGGGSSNTDTTPPSINDIKIKDITPFEATAAFTTSEETYAFALYSPVNSSSTAFLHNTGNLDWSTAKNIRLKSLRMGTPYRYAIKAVDKGGNAALSKEGRFETPFLSEGDAESVLSDSSITDRLTDLVESALPSLAPPFIEKPEIEEVGEDYAIINFKTNLRSYGLVAYATDKDFVDKKDYSAESSNLDERKKEHRFTVSQLVPNTKYHIVAKGFVFPEAIGRSSDITFTTKAAKASGRVVSIKNNSIRLEWTTAEPTTSSVLYTNEKTKERAIKEDDIPTTNHSVTLENLTPGTTYTLKAYGLNSLGNKIEVEKEFTVTTSKDITPPKISSLKIDSSLVPGRNDRVQAIVRWKTDEPSTSVVFYEEGSGSKEELSRRADAGESKTTDHVVVIGGLKTGSIYQIEVSSEDEAGNLEKLPVRTIITPRPSESIVDIIFKNFEDNFRFLKK